MLAGTTLLPASFSLKVLDVMLAACIGSLNFAVADPLTLTSIAPFAGVSVVTVGGVWSSWMPVARSVWISLALSARSYMRTLSMFPSKQPVGEAPYAPMRQALE